MRNIRIRTDHTYMLHIRSCMFSISDRIGLFFVCEFTTNDFMVWNQLIDNFTSCYGYAKFTRVHGHWMTPSPKRVLLSCRTCAWTIMRMSSLLGGWWMGNSVRSIPVFMTINYYEYTYNGGWTVFFAGFSFIRQNMNVQFFIPSI